MRGAWTADIEYIPELCTEHLSCRIFPDKSVGCNGLVHVTAPESYRRLTKADYVNGLRIKVVTRDNPPRP